jgi:hypothetical protein
MEAALVAGCNFYQDDQGYWHPTGESQNAAFGILEEVAKALDFRTVTAYLRTSAKPEEIRARLRTLLRHRAPAHGGTASLP